jgi:hypothetical protein
MAMKARLRQMLGMGGLPAPLLSEILSPSLLRSSFSPRFKPLIPSCSKPIAETALFFDNPLSAGFVFAVEAVVAFVLNESLCSESPTKEMFQPISTWKSVNQTAFYAFVSVAFAGLLSALGFGMSGHYAAAMWCFILTWALTAASAWIGLSVFTQFARVPIVSRSDSMRATG